MNALSHSDNCTWFSVGHAVFQSISAEVLRSEDITCISLLEWSNVFGLRRHAVAKTAFAAVSNLQLRKIRCAFSSTKPML